MTEIHPIIRDELLEFYRNLKADGTIRAPQQLQRYYDAFRQEFGPEILRSLQGRELLERMHAHGSKESLVYWLEFKDDETFPAIFGSIAGGSALKFGVYRRAETGTWATKGSGNSPKDIGLDEAIAIAERHREQLLAAVELLSALRADADDLDYLALQHRLAAVAPDVEDTAWGHKYVSLLFPAVLDDFHVSVYQRYNLTRVLQLPPRDGESWAEGRYVCAGRFVRLAQELDVPLHTAVTLLNHRHGPPCTYWRIGTTDDEEARRKYWPMMRDGELIAVGWSAIGDLSNFPYNQQSKDAIATMVRRHYPNIPQAVGRSATQLLNFVARMAVRDRVMVADGQIVLGIAEIAGEYHHDPSAPFPHQRPVKWKSLLEWRPAHAEALRTSVGSLKDPRNLVDIERHILEDAKNIRPRERQADDPDSTRTIPSVRGPLSNLGGVPGLIQSVLERKGQVVLYGPPGTGKTFWALHTARELAALRAFASGFASLQPEQRARIDGTAAGTAPLVRMTSFHPEYGYEDFIEGYRPRLDASGALAFALVPGVFRRVCSDAAAAPTVDFYLIIDEINRGDVPRIFGELLTLLEKDKRGERVVLPASGDAFHVPPNVLILGTMNTADRSIALLDLALRRRFGFVELMPDYTTLKDSAVAGLPLAAWLADINRRVRATGGGDARNRQIGHAFLLGPSGPITSIEQLAAVVRDDIVPLLEEYAYDDFGQLADVLGTGLVDVAAQRVKRELFEPARWTDLVAALQRPEIATAREAVMASGENADLEAGGEPNDEEGGESEVGGAITDVVGDSPG